MATSARRARTPTARRARSVAYNPPAIEADFSRGVITDVPASAMPVGAAWRMQDFFVHEVGRAFARGNWTYYGGALTNAGSTGNATHVAFAEFATGSQLIGGVWTGSVVQLYKNTNFTTPSWTYVADLGTGSGFLPVDKPKLVGEKLIFTFRSGTDAPKKFDGTTLAALGGTPPTGRYATPYKSRLVLAGSSGNPNRVWFSPTPDIEAAWDSAHSYLDCDYEIRGVAALQNSLLVFSKGHTERIVGDAPPPGGNMDRGVVAEVGCDDARSICVYGNRVIFASPKGVYITDGVSFENIVETGLISKIWLQQFAGYAGTGSIAAGVFRDHYVVIVQDVNSNVLASLACYLPRRAWISLTNCRFNMFATSVGQQEEFWASYWPSNRIAQLGGMWTQAPGAGYTDGNGTAATPQLITRALAPGPGLQHLTNGYLSYLLVDSVGGKTVTLKGYPGLIADTGTNVFTVPETMAATAIVTARKRFTVNKQDRGVSIQVSPPAADRFDLYGIELESRPLFAAGTR